MYFFQADRMRTSDIQLGDVIVVASDGVFDNVFDREIVSKT